MMKYILTPKRLRAVASRKIILPLVALAVSVCGQLSAQDAQSARVTLRMENTSLGKALDEIETQTKFTYIIRTSDLDLTQKVSISVRNRPLAETLDILLKGKNVIWEAENGKISIYKPQPQSEQRKITGMVTDAAGNPIAGASVIVKGKLTATVTNDDGSFTLEITGNPELEIYCGGYVRQTVATTGRTTVRVTMTEDVQMLEDLVVIGYGSLTRKELTSAISHISSDQFLNISSADPLMQIQGKVAGVSINNRAAADPNQSSSVQIRGITSRSASNSPLIVIDGVPSGNTMNVNENDIASMDVLKDGAASAIYGTRGSNGVILITTKKGAQDGRFHSSYSGYFSMDIVQHELTSLSADEFRAYRVPNGQIDYGYDTDWFEAVSRNGHAHKHTVTVSGGNTRSNYRGSFDFRDAKGIDLRSGRREYGGRLTATHTTKKGLLQLTANIAPRFIDRSNSSWAVFSDALLMNPTMPIMDPDDQTMYYNTQISPFNLVEKLKLEKDGNETKFLNWDATVKLELLPLLGPEKLKYHFLDTQATIAQEVNDYFEFDFRPSTSTVSIYNGIDGWASRAYTKNVRNSFEWTANYTFDNRVHRARAMVGYSYQYNVNSGLSAENGDFDNDALTYNNLGNGLYNKTESGRLGMGSYKNDSKLIAFFGRVTYDYKERYLATASLRHEGSSKFGANHKWGYFPAASVGWVISEENFMKDAGWITQLKLRADIGVTGNQDFSSYQSLATMRAFGSYYYMGILYNGWGWSKNVNPDLKWEKGVNKNIGVDFVFFNNRLGGSLNYYHRKQTDLLGTYNVPVPPNLFTTTYVNVGSMKNEGVEIELNARAVQTKDFSYDLVFTGSWNRNEFLSFSNTNYQGQDYYDVCTMNNPNNPGTLQRIEVGQPVGNYYTYSYAGLDDKGNWLVWNKDNTEKIAIGDAAAEDKRITGNGMPKYNLSLNNTFRYKNLDLNIFFRAALGFELFNVHEFYYGLQSMEGNVLMRSYSKNRAVTGGMNQVSDYFIEKGDYLKLDMVSLGYNLNFRDTSWISKVRVYLTGRNLYTFTKFTGVDPSTYPANGLTPGTFDGDFRYYPSTIQVLLGVQIDF